MKHKCKMQVKKILFPKGATAIESGEFGIFTAKVIEVIEGEEPKINEDYGTVSLKGICKGMKEGDKLTFIFNNPEENKYGVSYDLLNTVVEINPDNKEELKDYFEVLCGKTLAKELMKIDNAYHLLKEKNSEELLKVKGIGETKLNNIYKNMDSLGDNGQAFAKLVPLGISKKTVAKMCSQLGGSQAVLDICYNSPYVLIDKIKGFGFLKADEIAIKCNSVRLHDRVKYAITHTLEINAQQGKSYLTAQQLLSELKRILSCDFSVVNEQIMKLYEEGKIILSQDGNSVALTKYMQLEKDIFDRLVELEKADTYIEIPQDWKEQIEEIEKNQGWSFTAEQKYGIEQALKKNIILIRGLAGTGKSTITNAITHILNSYQVEMCCLSAKAAQRLREVTGERAQTIHKALSMGVELERHDTELYADIVIVDEASMISGTLFLKLLKAIRKGSKVIILGDSGQLTAIGDCSVFNDLVNSDYFTVIELTTIHRQAEKSAIITDSIKLRKQIPIYENDFRGTVVHGELQDLKLTVESTRENLLNLALQEFMSSLPKYGLEETQIVVPTKKGDLGVKSINAHIQNLITNKTTNKFIVGRDNVEIYEGDKVINTKNNYSSNPNVFNGNIGFVKEIRKDGCLIDFIGVGEVFLKENWYEFLDLAYAITIHSAQGSQWEKVICCFDMSSYTMLYVEMLYTAITRASKECSLIIEHWAMNKALKTVEQKTKQKFLQFFLSQSKNK